VTTPDGRRFRGVWLGRRSYAVVEALQTELSRARILGHVPDTVLLLEHEPVVTLGRRADPSNVLLSEEALRARGVEYAQASRGGDVTLHAPGQLVAYPIVSLAPDRRDVRRYVRDLAETMRRVCLRHGISGGEVSGLVGLWVDLDTVSDWQGARDGARLAKIGAIGVRISQWVTSHGFALNVSTAPDLFRMIVPCGIRDHEVTSIFELSAARPEVLDVAHAALDAMSRIMGAEVVRFDDLSTTPLEPWITELRAGNSIDQTLPSL
jgi:lipoyl(octanoyl) transferase